MKEEKKPFFARFLEGQEATKIRTGIKAGFPIVTHKFPSDDDEYPTS